MLTCGPCRRSIRVTQPCEVDRQAGARDIRKPSIPCDEALVSPVLKILDAAEGWREKRMAEPRRQRAHGGPMGTVQAHAKKKAQLSGEGAHLPLVGAAMASAALING